VSPSVFLALALALPDTGSPRAAAPEVYAGRTLDQWREIMKDLDPNNPGSAAALPGLLAIVEDRQVPWFTRRQAALTLGRMGELSAEQAVPLLIELLEEPSSTEEPTRIWAVKALALFRRNARAAAPALVAILRDESAPLADRLVSLEALARIGTAHRDAVPAIIETLAAGDGSLRELAAEALALVGPGAAEAVPALMRAARDPDERLRRKSVQALGAMGAAAEIAIPVLAEALVLDESLAVRDAAAEALSRVGVAALPALVHFLADEDPETRRRAALALGKMGRSARTAASALQSALKDKNPEVGVEAAHALWKITSDPDLVIPQLVALLTDDDRQVRIRAFRLLTSMGPAARSALAPLRNLLNDQRAYVRQAAEKAIERIEAES
jgi:HEAT repeat protein